MASLFKYWGIVCTAFVCYSVTLFGTFVFDDSEAIIKNKDILPSTPISEVFRNDFWGTDISLNKSHKSYRPLTILTYRLNLMLSDSKLDAFQFHMTNVLLYVVLCVLTVGVFKLFLFEKRHDGSDRNVAYFASLLFAVHPVHTEVVAGLVGRADILSSILFLVSVLLYNKVLVRKSIFLFIMDLFVIWAAVLCKETAITALGFLLIYDVVHSKLLEEEFSYRTHQGIVIRSICLFVAGVTIMYFRLLVMNFEGPTFTSIDNPAAYCDSFFSRVFTYNYIYFLNILLLLWPQWLCFDWSMGCIPLLESFSDIRILFVIFFWCFTFAIIYKTLNSIIKGNTCKSTILGISLVVLPFLPASNLFLKVGFVIAERTLLLPSCGYCFLVVFSYSKLDKYFKKNQRLHYGLLFALCLIFALRTIQRNFDWLSEKSLFTSALKVCPLNAKVHYNVGKVAADENNKSLASQEYRKAIELNPRYEQAMNNLANLLREDKNFNEAELLLRKAVEVRPNFAAAWMNLGIILTNLNQVAEAEECYLKAISFRNKYPDCYYNLGNLYLDLKRNKDALVAWEKAVSYKPSHTAAWSNTLVLLDSTRKYDDVLRLGRKALMYNPKSPTLHFSIANTLGKMQQFEKAEKHFLEALHLSPLNALYYSNLGVLYHRWGKLNKAKEMYIKALLLEPNMKTTENNLKKLTNS